MYVLETPDSRPEGSKNAPIHDLGLSSVSSFTLAPYAPLLTALKR